MGGGSAGIMGTGGSDNTVLNDLKNTCVSFAKSYINPTKNKDEVADKSKQIEGLILNLHLSSTLSEKESSNLIDQLINLVDKY